MPCGVICILASTSLRNVILVVSCTCHIILVFFLVPLIRLPVLVFGVWGALRDNVFFGVSLLVVCRRTWPDRKLLKTSHGNFIGTRRRLIVIRVVSWRICPSSFASM